MALGASAKPDDVEINFDGWTFGFEEVIGKIVSKVLNEDLKENPAEVSWPFSSDGSCEDMEHPYSPLDLKISVPIGGGAGDSFSWPTWSVSLPEVIRAAFDAYDGEEGPNFLTIAKDLRNLADEIEATVNKKEAEYDD